MWKYIVPDFEENYQIILLDYVGSGESQLEYYSSEKYSDLHGYAQDVIEVMDTLELRNAIFVAHSVSSMIGMLASIRDPKYFERMIMIGPSPRYVNDLPDYYGGFDKRDIDELLHMMR